jgi:hypothetical protein
MSPLAGLGGEGIGFQVLAHLATRWRTSGAGEWVKVVRRLPVILVLVHSALILLIAGGVYASLVSGKHEAVQLWALPTAVDLPVAWLIAGLEAMLKSRLDEAGEMARWMWFPAGTFLVVGGLWWWLVGVVIGRFAERRNAPERRE